MTEDKIIKTLQMIKNDKSLEDHFFSKLSIASKPLEWLIPLREAGYFAPDRNPKPQEVPNKKGYYTVPHWNVLDSLVNMAVKNEETIDKEVSRTLFEIVNGIIAYRENGKRIDNYRTEWKILETICHFPIYCINSQHIQFIKDSLHSNIGFSLVAHEVGKKFLPKLIKEKASELLLQLLDAILDFNKSNRDSSSEYISVMDSFYLKETLDKNKQGIANLCTIEAAIVAIDKMKRILDKDETQFNYIWIPTIEDHSQTAFPDRYECQIVHFVRDMLERASHSEIELIIHDMIQSKHDIFVRLAYHLINHHYETLNHLLWNISFNPLNSITIHELYELFHAHSKRFDENQIGKILDWIESQELYMSDEVKGDSNRMKSYEAYYKKEWLFALLDSENTEAKRRFDKYHAINDVVYEHPGFHYWSYGVGSVVEVSPISEDDFRKMSNEEIVSYIINYKEESKMSWKDFTSVNLASSIRKFVSKDPTHYSKELQPFLSIPRKYQYEILRGFEEAWRNGSDIEWDDLLPFMKALIETRDFWTEDKKEGEYDYNRWIANTIAELIQEGTKDDKHAFSPDLMPIAEEILLILLNNVHDEMSSISDLVTSVLNSSKGKVFIATINYSLRNARLYAKDRNDRWIQSIKSEFTLRLNKTIEPSLEFSVILGWYLPYLNYLDSQWVVNNINKIFDTDSDKHWEAAFIGYIVMTSTVYEELYKLLRDNGQYERGVASSFADKHVGDKLVQNIVIGYIAGWDDLNNETGLLNKLLVTNNNEYLSSLVTFMWTFRDNGKQDISDKVKPLWKRVIEQIAILENDGYRLVDEAYSKIASNLGRWLSLVDTIDDDIYKWLLVSVNAIKENWNSGFFIEYLLKHVTKTPDKVANLFYEMLKGGTYPSYKEEDIVAIVETLYDANLKESADRICTLYLAQGYKFLIKIFDAHRIQYDAS